jgi:cell division septation protein DedD
MENQDFNPPPEEQIPAPENNPLPPENEPENELFSWLKNAAILLVLLLVVMASFWVSFQLGKRILSPAKNSPEKISIVLPEPPPSLKALQKALSAEASMPPKKTGLKMMAMPKALAVAPAPVVAPKPIVTTKPVPVKISEPVKAKTVAAKPPKEAVAAKAVVVAPANHYYKVQAAVLKSKDSAATYANKVKAAGFSTYVKKTAAGWRVQVGAFKTKSEAEKLQKKLTAKGFTAKVIYE